MADARYVIDLIINARDNTAAAMAKATANVKAFEKVQDDLDRQNQRTRKSFAELTNEIRSGDQKMKDLQRTMGVNEQAIRASADQMVALEKASRNYIKTIDDQNASEAEIAVALVKRENAEKDLNKALAEGTRLSQKRRDSVVEDVRLTAEQIQQAEQLRQVQAEASRATAEIERERMAQMRLGAEMAQEIEQDELARHRSRLQRVNADAQAEREMAGVRQALRTAEDRQAAEAETTRQANFETHLAQLDRQAQAEREMAGVRLALGRQESEQARALEADRQASFEVRQAQLERQAQAEQEMAQVRIRLGEQEAAQAAREEEARQTNFAAREAQLQREQQAIQELAEVRRSLGEAEQRQAADQEAARVANFEARQAQLQRDREAAEAAAQRRIELNRILDRSEAEATTRRIRNAEDENRGIQQLEADRRRAAQEREVQQTRELSFTRQYIEQIQRVASLERERGRARPGTIAAQRLDFDVNEARTKAEAFAVELRALFGRIQAKLDVDSSSLTEHEAAILAQKEIIGKDIHINVDVDAARAVGEMAAASAAMKTMGDDSSRLSGQFLVLRGLAGAVGESFNNSSSTIASFDNFLRGLMSLGIAAFFNQLILLAGAAASALLSLASSAAVAGAALGGALAAGVAQAIPAVGILATAVSRMSAVFNAAKQAQLLQQQQSYQGEKQNKRVADTTDAVRGAQDRLADTNRRVAEAQKNVNDARQQGIDKLQELILQERGLSLTMDETQAAIRKAAGEGRSGALPRLFLQRDETQRRLTTTRAEITERREAGPGASPELLKAQEQLRDAQRAARAAASGIERAQRSADEAAAGVTAAAGKLDFLMGQLSGAEQRMYRAVRRLQEVWRTFSQEATEPLIIAFTGAITKVTDLLGSKKILDAARGLATGLADQFKRVFDDFTSSETIGQWLRIVEQSKDNLKPLGDIAIDIAHAFLDIAEAAGPALNQIIEWVGDVAKGVADFFREGRKSGDLGEFFETGVTHLKAWGDLLYQVVRLFAAIVGPGGGAESGLKLVQDMGEGIGKWADAINDPKSKINDFFQDFFTLGRQMLDVMGPVFGSLADQFRKTFSKEGVDSVKGFSTFLSDTLIPAVGKFARLLGRITGDIGKFAREHPNVTKFGSSMLAAALAWTVFARAFTIFGPLQKAVGFLGRELLGWEGSIRKARRAAKGLEEGVEAVGKKSKGVGIAEEAAGVAGGRGTRRGIAEGMSEAGAAAAAGLPAGTRKPVEEAEKNAGRMRGAFKKGFEESAREGNKFRRTLSALALPLIDLGSKVLPIGRLGPVFTKLGGHVGGVRGKIVGLGDDAVKKAGPGFTRAFGPLGGILSKVVGPMSRLAFYFGRFAALGAGPILLIVGILVGLVALSGKLDDVWRKILSTGQRIWKEIQPSIEDVKQSVQGLIDAFGGGGDSGLLKVLKAIGSFIADVMMAAIDAFGDVFIGVFKAIADVLSGFIHIITGIVKLFSGDWRGALDEFGAGFGRIFKGLFDLVKGIFTGIIGFIADIFSIGAIRRLGQSIIDGFVSAFSDLGNSIVGFFQDAWDAVLGFFGVASPSTLARDLGAAIVDGLVEGIKALVGAWLGVVGWLWDRWLAGLRREIRGLRAVGRWIYNAARDAIHAVGRLLGDLGEWVWNRIKNAIRREIRGLSAIGRWVWNAIRSAFEAVVDLFRSVGKWVWDKIKEAIRLEIRGWKAIGTWLYNAIKGAVDGTVGKFKDIGKAIITAVIDGVKAAPGAFADAIAWLIDKIPGIPGFVKNKIKEFLHIEAHQEGGPVGGSGRGDVIPALLEPGEHVWTRTEVERAGGHGVMYALRALFGGGTQALGQKMQGGGYPTPRAQGQTGAYGSATGAEAPPSQPQEAKAVEEDRKDIKKSNDQRATDFRVMWHDMLATARRYSNDISKQIREMRVETTATLRRMRRDSEKILDDIADRFDSRGSKIVDSWSATYDSIKQVVYEGLNYIGHETNKALHALDQDTINFGLSAPVRREPERAPGAGHAGGGMVGYPGERGRDSVRTWLGRGEAVLNYAQQKYVEPAVQAYYGHGLSDTFKRVRGYHAGGKGQPGYATGRPGAIDVMGSKPGFAVLMQFFRQKFNDPSLYVISGSRPGSIVAGSGNLSNHSGGHAIDISNPQSVGGSPSNPPPQSSLDKLYPFLQKWSQPPRRDLLWRTTQGGNHFNHIHLGMDDSVTATLEKAKAWVKSKGGDVDVPTDIKRRIVEGVGPLKEAMQKVLDKVRDAATKKIEDSAPSYDADAGGSVPLGPGGPGQKIFDYFVARGFSEEQAAAWVGNFVQESGLNPSAVQPGGPGRGLAQWGGGRFAALQAFARDHNKPWQDMQTQLDFVWHELQGSESGAYQRIKSARSLADAVAAVGQGYERFGIQGNRLGPAQQALQQYGGQHATGGIVGEGDHGGEFAAGGTVPGGEGEPVPILAHAGEWVLNRMQQSRLASMLGVGAETISSLLGFSGAPKSHYQTGGQIGRAELSEHEPIQRRRAARRGQYVAPFVDPQSLEGVIRDVNLVNRAIRHMSRRGDLGKRVERWLNLINNLTGENGLIAQMATQIEELGTRLQRNIDLAKVGYQRVGRKLQRRPGGALVDAVEIADRVVDMNAEIYRGLRSQRRQAERGLSSTNARIRRLRQGGIRGKAEEDQFVELLGKRNEFTKDLDDIDGKILDNRTAMYEAQLERFNAQTEAALKPSAGFGVAEKAAKIAEIIGNESGVEAFGNLQVTEFQRQRNVYDARIAEATRNLGRGTRGEDQRWQAVIDDLTAKRDELDISVQQQIHDNLASRIDAINNRFSRQAAERDITRRVASALGNTQTLSDLAGQDIADYNAQIAELLAVDTTGDPGLARSIAEQVADLRAKVTETSAQMLRDAIDEIDKAASRREAHLAILGRAADLRERIGGAGAQLNAIRDRQDISRQRAEGFGGDLIALQARRSEAELAGNTGAVKDLDDKMEDLRQTIAEEIQTGKELIYTYRSVATEIITGRAERATGLISTGSQLLQKAGELIGSVDFPALTRLLVESGDVLRTTAGQIATNVREALGAGGEFADTTGGGILGQLVTAFQQGPAQFGTVLAELGPQIAALEATMGETERTAFQKLIDSMITNTTAVLDNTDQLNQVNGRAATAQSFSSSLWQMFRIALFSGNTTLLPGSGFSFPSFQTGGYVQQTGLYRLHAGEKVINAAQTNRSEQLEQNLYITNPTEVVDPDYIFSVAEFHRSNRRAT